MRGSPNKTPVVTAVTRNHDGHPVALRMSAVAGFHTRERAAWAAKFIRPARSDGLGCSRGIADAAIEHQVMATGGDASAAALPQRRSVNTILDKIKRAMKGIYPKASRAHLPRDLAGFRYRFDRRFDLAALRPHRGLAAAHTPPVP